MMDLNLLFKSVIDQDDVQIVLCNLDHEILYMNPAAVRDYEKRGGAALIGQSLLNCHNPNSVTRIQEVVAWFAESTENNKVHTTYDAKKNRDIYMIALRDGDGTLIGYYEKHEYRNPDPEPFYEMK